MRNENEAHNRYITDVIAIAMQFVSIKLLLLFCASFWRNKYFFFMYCTRTFFHSLCGQIATQRFAKSILTFNPFNAELNTICHLLALLGAHPTFHVSRIRVNIYLFSTATSVRMRLSVPSYVHCLSCCMLIEAKRSEQTPREFSWICVGLLHVAVIFITLV